MLGKITKKDPERSLKMIQLFAGYIGNLSACDAMAMQGLKPIFKIHQQQIFALAKKYDRSTDFWQRRLSLVLAEWYTIIKELHPEIKKLVKALENDEEYYVKKAIAWINKNFEKKKWIYVAERFCCKSLQIIFSYLKQTIEKKASFPVRRKDAGNHRLYRLIKAVQ